MTHRCSTTAERIHRLNHDEVFVFGSNLGGRHGAGAARQAMRWGAVYGNPRGIQGDTYAVPTKDKSLNTLPVREIKHYVDVLFHYIVDHVDRHFLITKIGCGLAGYAVEDIAPLFHRFQALRNVSLPEEFMEKEGS